MNTLLMHKFSKGVATMRMQGIRFFYIYFINPRSTTEDSRRHEYILNIVLFSSIIAMIVLEVFLLVSWISSPVDYKGISIFLFTTIALLFILLLYISRRGYFVLASYILITLYFLSTTYGIYKWGFLFPASFLGYVITIIITSILINTRAALIATVVVTTTTTLIAYLQIRGVIFASLEWQTQQLYLKDAIVPCILLLFVMVISWLSNREIESSLVRARRSEQALLRERDSLEVKVEERTRELKQIQQEKLGQLYHFAEFGRLSSGIFHDLVNPLNSLIAHVSELETVPTNLPVIKTALAKAVATSKRMGEFIATVKKQVRVDDIEQDFLINKEIEEAVDILQYRAREANVLLKLRAKKKLITYGNPLKFHQIAVNLIANAIDATEQTGKKDSVINIRLSKYERSAVFSVTDEGCGISQSIRDRIFDPFFTTKSARGIGLGLSTTKTITEKEFDGTIIVHSIEGLGSNFIITIPLRKRERVNSV